MKISLHFGISEPGRVVNWWQPIEDFPYLVLFKGKKWEFVMYQPSPDEPVVQYKLYFSEMQSYNPNWYATTYVDIDYLLNTGYGSKCECGAIYTSFPNGHMFFCPKWSKF